MTINGIYVKRGYTPARIISDVISLGITGVIVYMTVTFKARYSAAVNAAPNAWQLLEEYRYSLATRYRIAWIFPALCAAVFAAYLILTMTDRVFKKASVTKKNVRQIYDRYAFTVSLCKAPVLMIVFDYMYIAQQRLMFRSVSFLSASAVIYALLTVIIIRAGAHKIMSFKDKDERSRVSDGGVKARLAEDSDNEENNKKA